MPLTTRRFTGDEELGKKDDDHRPTQWGARSSAGKAWKGPRRRRIIFGIIGIYLVYLFFKNMPTDLPKVANPRLPYAPGGSQTQAQSRAQSNSLSSGAQSSIRRTPPTGPPPHPEKTEEEKHFFNGPIKFYLLAETLQDAFGRHGAHYGHATVLFAASSLKSAANILPMACDMAKYGRNSVHFALMGRDDIPILTVQKLNGVTDADCPIKWHDARPDYSQYSTDYRMEISTRASLGHFAAFGSPKVIITDELTKEDSFFAKAIVVKAAALGISMIHIPTDSGENLQWLTRLESNALRAWNEVEIEILIHAQTGSSGSLIRLLKSIESADYFGSALPSITIELPPDVDQPTLRFLEAMAWPLYYKGQNPNSKITLRHRLQSKSLTAAEASLRTIESFYPKNPDHTHILLLSPQAELSPTYFHYLKYTLLEYRYTEGPHKSNTVPTFESELMGISLDLPTTSLDGKTAIDLTDAGSSVKPQALVLHDAPNSNAALYFGDKWVELHNFIPNRFAAQSKYKKPPMRPKAVSEQSPAWLEYMVELARSRGYSMIYPSFTSNPQSALVTLHNELYQIPEEFLRDAEGEKPAGDDAAVDIAEYPFTADPADPGPVASIEKPEALLASKAANIVRLLGLKDNDILPDPVMMPIFAFSGVRIAPSARTTAVETYLSEFRSLVGGCLSKPSNGLKQEKMRTDDLFCLD